MTFTNLCWTRVFPHSATGSATETLKPSIKGMYKLQMRFSTVNPAPFLLLQNIKKNKKRKEKKTSAGLNPLWGHSLCLGFEWLQLLYLQMRCAPSKGFLSIDTQHQSFFCCFFFYSGTFSVLHPPLSPNELCSTLLLDLYSTAIHLHQNRRELLHRCLRPEGNSRVRAANGGYNKWRHLHKQITPNRNLN